MLLTQEQEMIRDAIRTFVREAITPHAAAWDRDATFPKDVHRQLGELGAYGVAVPEELGGDLAFLLGRRRCHLFQQPTRVFISIPGSDLVHFQVTKMFD